MATKKITQLTQGTVAELADACVMEVSVDPSGTPASKKSTLARLGLPPASSLDTLAAHAAYGANNAGNFSVGVKFCARRTGQQCTGVRFYWNHATSLTVRGRLWKGGASQATADGGVNGAGLYTITWAGVNLTQNEDWFITIWETTSARYQLHSDGSRLPAAPLWYRNIVVVNHALYAAGDAEPTTSPGASTAYPVEPIITG